MALRPTDLDILFRPVTSLTGVGPRLSQIMVKLFPHLPESVEPRLIDLILHKPAGLIDRRTQPGITNAVPGEIATFKVTIDEHRPPPRGNRRVPYRVGVHDETGDLALVFFHGHNDYLIKTLPLGETRYVSGRVEDYGGLLQMPHPDHIVTEEAFHALPLVEPIYPLTAGLSSKVLSKAMRQAVESIPTLTEWNDNAMMKRQKWPSFKLSLEAMHKPGGSESLSPENPAIQRLSYDELLASQLALALTRKRVKKVRGVPKIAEGKLFEAIKRALPFELTDAQETALVEIREDLEAPERMLRVLQGDVGAGKTVVALLTMASAIEAGYQTALMAPTEILARQHMKTISEFSSAAGLNVEILTGREKGAQRRTILERTENGEIDILIGTHALFQPTVHFKKLGFVIIDEQHRFGVQQRLQLTSKGEAVDLLAMTATPIPRTLVLTYFGDMDVSKLQGKPKGRQPIHTTTASLDRISEITERVAQATDNGEKVYWVCPLVEENEELDFTAAEHRYQELRGALGHRVALVHGQMLPAEKEAAMQRFKSSDASILVATTVIEVGVDVPDATIIVIEHAERFGLSQLHQLRGRVGRGSRKSSCLLLYKSPLGEVARQRLQVMKDTEDGFVIAEEDLKLRGEGDLLGTRQSGMPGFRIAELAYHGDLLQMARDDARLMVEKDADLETGRGIALRRLLYLFNRDEAIKLLKAG